MFLKSDYLIIFVLSCIVLSRIILLYLDFFILVHCQVVSPFSFFFMCAYALDILFLFYYLLAWRAVFIWEFRFCPYCFPLPSLPIYSFFPFIIHYFIILLSGKKHY